MSDEVEPIAVRFPLSGEWCAVNTPGYKIPSHGIDRLGQRYAYDFIQIDWNRKNGFRFSNTPLIQSVFFAVRLEDTFCWSQPIFSPFEGEVVELRGGCKERDPVHAIRDLAVVIKNAITYKVKNNDGLLPLLRNYIILRGREAFAPIAHARCNSIEVSQGEVVGEGQQLAEVGHSGNSTAPHRHFQLMDKQELLEAKGLTCCFKKYQLFNGDKWGSVKNGISGRSARISA